MKIDLPPSYLRAHARCRLPPQVPPLRADVHEVMMGDQDAIDARQGLQKALRLS